MTAKFSGITHKIFIEQDASSTQISTDTITNIDMFGVHKILLRKEILLKSPSSQLKSPSAKVSSEVKDPTTKGSINNCIASAAQDIADFIRIVDNITTNDSKPRNSVTIKGEIKKVSS